ncbi:MAG: glutamate-1-semialdehyde 2,1-aminomutase [Phycisphaerae bacterium]
MLSFARSARHQARAHRVIPGAAHTYAKGDDQFPEGMCPVVVRGKGAVVWDRDGNRLIEYGAGVRAVTLGHGHPLVCTAAARAMANGTNFVRPAALELAAAEKFLQMIHPAEMVKFCKNGSDATTAAVKLARAATGRDLVLVCRNQPFFSVDDWFIATTDTDAGIPTDVARLTLTFGFNDLPGIRQAFAQHPSRIACVMLEAENGVQPEPGFLPGLLELCHVHGALFVLDETITGFRVHNGGGQTLYGITPDLSTFGKAMGNGFAVSALAGRRQYMELGGLLQTDREKVFLLSTTHGAETHGLAAFLAVARVYREQPVVERLHAAGRRLREGFNARAADLGIAEHLHVIGRDACLIYVTKDVAGNRSQPYRTLFMQEMLSRGILAPNFFVNLGHSDELIDQTLDAAAAAMHVYRDALSAGTDRFLRGRSVKPVFRRYN